MKTDPNCLFCKIIAGVIPCSKVYEDQNTFAFLDINPNSKGHTLIVPKRHVENIVSEDADQHILETVMSTAQKVARATITGIHAERSILLIEGELVPHLHVHVIPKFSNTKLKIGDHISYENESEKEKFREILAQTLSGLTG